MPAWKLAVGSGEFWDLARADIAAAQRRVLIQAMTWEGDAAGLQVAEAIGASGAADRRVLVDDYTSHNINDTMLLFSQAPALMEEQSSTLAMFSRLKGQGVGVRVTDPVGRNPARFVSRNHKKLLVMDDVAWIGGINFSDHNFDWHDTMLRIEDAEIAGWLAAQFGREWNGAPAYERREFGSGLTMLSLDGVTNAAGFAEVLALFEGAERSIEVLSAYPTQPFTEAMARAAARGVRVTIHTPWPSNKPTVRNYLLGFAPKRGITLSLLPRMTHAKAALIDERILLFGSSNFDFASYRVNNEFVAVIRDPALIAEVRGKLLDPARSAGREVPSRNIGRWRSKVAHAALKLAELGVSRVSKGARMREWD
jgi:cardiolipin synthase